jgi:DNA-binding NarL/FixJ family response regulator
MTRILIADDHPVVRSGVRRIIESHAGWTVVAESADGRDAITKALASKPDVAILDYAMPLINGIEATRQIRQRVPSVAVLIFTMHDTEHLLREAFNAGARGYLLKSDAQQQLISAVQALADHRSFFTDRASQVLLENFLTRRSRIEQPLTDREQTIVRLVADGHSNKQMANLLNITLKTVQTYRATIKRKLDLGSTAAMVRYAIRNKLSDA